MDDVGVRLGYEWLDVHNLGEWVGCERVGFKHAVCFVRVNALNGEQFVATSGEVNALDFDSSECILELGIGLLVLAIAERLLDAAAADDALVAWAVVVSCLGIDFGAQVACAERLDFVEC